jgi:hypothetical protein
MDDEAAVWVEVALTFNSGPSDADAADPADAVFAVAVDCNEEEEEAAAVTGNSILCKRSVVWRGSINGPDLFDRSEGDEDDDVSVPDEGDACEEEDAEVVDAEAMGSEE